MWTMIYMVNTYGYGYGMGAIENYELFFILLKSSLLCTSTMILLIT